MQLTTHFAKEEFEKDGPMPIEAAASPVIAVQQRMPLLTVFPINLQIPIL